MGFFDPEFFDCSFFECDTVTVEPEPVSTGYWLWEQARYEHYRRETERIRREELAAALKKQQEIEAESARIAREEAQEARVQAVFETIEQREAQAQEREALAAEIERLAAYMNAEYRAEVARRAEADRVEIEAIIFLMLTEV